MKIGYCCINLSINKNRKKKDFIQVNRGMVRKTFDSKGLDYVSELVILNLKDTLEILKWNLKNGILVYRLSSDSFPWMTEYEFHNLPKFDKICEILKEIGDFAKTNNIRLSLHPPPFVVLGSENPNVVTKSIFELDQHSKIMDLMGLDQTTYYPINIHVNTTRPTRELATDRFCQNFKLLSNSCQRRLTVENDDKESQYSVRILHNLVHSKIGIPIVFDQMHFKFGPQDQSMEDALKLAISTWKTRPITHMSSSRKIEDTKSRSTAHADMIYEKIESFGMDFDVEIEAKSKDIAVLDYLNKYKDA